MRAAKTGRLKAAASAVALSMMLAACGGGGGNGVESTPTPTPSPTPTPGPTNTSLQDLQYNQTFRNDAAITKATLSNSDGDASGISAEKTSLAFSYNATDKSYSVSSTAGSQTFKPSDLSASGLGVAIYGKKSGSTTETLYLSAAGAGTQYVSGGIYEKLTKGASSTTASNVAFNYGIPTPDGAVPRSGKALYSASLYGTMVDDTAYRLNGYGSFIADFGAGTLKSDGLARVTRVFDGANWEGPAWTGTASISTTSSTFSGPFDIGGINGTWNGSFYGPDGKEIGATFSAQATGVGFTGYILGSTGDTAYYYQFIPNFTTDVAFGPVQYLAADQSYTFRPNSNQQIRVTGADIVAAESDARYTVYRNGDSTDIQELHLFNPGANNPDIQLSYTTFGLWERTRTEGGVTKQTNYAILGVTGPTILDSPRTGTATYEAQVYGKGVISGPYTRDIRGDATFDMNFDTYKLTGSMTAKEVDPDSVVVHDYGSFTFANGTVFNRSINSDISDGLNKVGSLNGTLYGPDGVELGASFNLRVPVDAYSSMGIEGVIVGKIVTPPH